MGLLRNFSFTFTANLITFLLNAGVTFVIPKFVGVSEYSYYQLFQFYISYVGYLQFGWVDGMYLRLGGKYYDELDTRRIHTQWRLYMIFTFIIAAVVMVCALLGKLEADKRTVFFLTGVSALNILPLTWLQYILQATNRMKENAIIIIIRSVLFLFGIVVLLIGKIGEFEAFCVAYMIAQFISFLYAAWVCRSLIVNRCVSIGSVLGEIKQDIFQGLHLTVATVASVLMIGLVRLAIEYSWGVEVFGRISLTLSVSNLLMLFVRAVSLVMFPALRRIDQHALSGIYANVRTALMTVLLGMLAAYYPIKVCLSAWLPQYAESLNYMAILFPMCVFESKTSMLIETYMKTLRKEKWLLLTNIAMVILSAVLAGIAAFWLHDLNVAVLSVVVLVALRCIISELLLTRMVKIQVKKDIALEVTLVVIFIVSSWTIGGLTGLAIYSAAYGIYLLIKRNSLMVLAQIIRRKFKKRPHGH